METQVTNKDPLVEQAEQLKAQLSETTNTTARKTADPGTAETDTTKAGLPRGVSLITGESPNSSRPFMYSRLLRGFMMDDWSHSKLEKQVEDTLLKYFPRQHRRSLLLPWSIRRLDNEMVALDLPLEERANFGEGSSGVGGALVFPLLDKDIIPRLYNKLVIYKAAEALGINIERQLPPSGQLKIPRRSGKAAITWVGGGTAPTQNDASNWYDQVSLAAKKAIGTFGINNELIRDAVPSYEEDLREEIVRAFAEEEDLNFLQGATGGNNPVGLSNITSVNKSGSFPTDAAPANLDFDALLAMMRAIEDAKGDLGKCAWFACPRTKYSLYGLKDNYGRYLIQPAPALGLPDRVWNIPIFTSTQIPSNVTTGGATPATNTTSFYLVQVDTMLVGRHVALEIAFDESFAFTSDVTTVRAIERLDFSVKYPQLVVIAEGVKN